MNVLVRHAARRCILIGAETIVMLCPPQITLDVPEGTAVSLFPMNEVGCQSTGLQWPTNGLRFAPDSRIGTLNRAKGAVTLTPDAPKLLLILPREALDLTVRSILGSDAKWPALAE
jgi:thiamine pyrophosphokinase